MQQNTFLIVLASIIALSGGLFVRSLSGNDQQQASIPALELNLPDIDDNPRSLSEWQGKIRIINFWATWCPPCIKEIPEFIRLQNEFNDKNLQFIGIALEDKQTVEQYLKNNPVNYPMLIGGDKAIALSQQLGNIVNAVPFSLIINHQGQIIHRQPGELSREKIIEIITPLL
ncbi:MAG: redoxin domain-containing protein [Methylococcaceae bacterium]|nr:redoxin domain-containing protein [Methylococcaceae bacterium]